MRIKFTPQAILPLAAAGLFVFAISSVIRPSPGRADPVIAPPASPYAATLSGVGVVEPQGEIIAIATELPGVVREVFVASGEAVAAGAALFRLDQRALQAALVEARAGAAASRAAVELAAVNLADEQRRQEIFDSIDDKRAISVDELDRIRFAVRRAAAALAQAGAAAEAAAARVALIETDLARQTVSAPTAGTILSVNIRPGEFAAAGPLSAPLMSMGAAAPFHVRVEIDESDISRFAPGSRAIAHPRGDATLELPLRFVRIEPQAAAKRTLAGGSERVDARVVEIVFALPETAPVLVGRRLDVFIENEARASVASAR